MKAPATRLPRLLLLLASAGLTVAAGLMLFSTFMFYDDEGYVLISVRNFAEHGHLYGSVYSQYGPFPYVFYYFLHLLGLPLVHLTERAVTLLAWSGSATLAAGLSWRATRNLAAMLAVLAAAFVYLWIMVSEPGHPGGLIVVTTVIMAAAGCHWLAAGRWSAWAALAGAGCAVLLLTKINVGVFAALSAFSLLVLHSRNDRVRRWAPWVLAAGFALLPYLLTRPLLGEPWVQTFSLVFALSAVAAIGAAARGAGPDCGSRPWLAAVLGGGIVALIVLGTVFARGTTPAELLQGIILGPLHHPGHFSLVFRWPPGAGVVAIISLGIFLLASIRARRPAGFPVDPVVAGLRLLAAAGVALLIARFPGTSPDNQLFAYFAPCLWLFLWPLSGATAPAVRAQAWLGLLFLGQWLHVFPVPGSQIAWGTVLAIPLVAIGAWEAAVWLAQNYFTGARRVRAAGLALQLGLLALAGVTGVRLAEIGGRYLDSRPLSLPGAEVLRLPDTTTSLFRLLVFNAEAHGDMVFSLPGMFSLNLWSGLPTPTLTNVTHWFSLLDEAQQQAIIQVLAAHPNACIVVQTEHLKFLREHQLTPGGPLYDYVMREFEPAFEVDGFEFRVHRGRHIAPLLTGEVFEEKTAPGAAAGRFNTLIRMHLLLPADQPIASVEIARADDPGSPSLRLQGANARIEVTPVDLSGDARGQTEARTFPFALRGPAMVALYFDGGGRKFPTGQTLLIVRNAAGAELALVRLR